MSEKIFTQDELDTAVRARLEEQKNSYEKKLKAAQDKYALVDEDVKTLRTTVEQLKPLADIQKQFDDYKHTIESDKLFTSIGVSDDDDGAKARAKLKRWYDIDSEEVDEAAREPFADYLKRVAANPPAHLVGLLPKPATTQVQQSPTKTTITPPDIKNGVRPTTEPVKLNLDQRIAQHAKLTERARGEAPEVAVVTRREAAALLNEPS